MGSETERVMVEDSHKKLKLEETESTKWVCKEDVRVKGRFMNIFRIR